MDTKVLESITDQINHEFYSAYFYLSMSAWCEAENLPGFASWLKFYAYLLDRGEKVVLKAIPQPPAEFASPKDVFEKVYEHEKKVTALINAIYEKALAAKDVATQVEMQWFIKEQVEEEKNASSILDLVTKIGSSLGALYQLDHQLGKRS